MKIKKMTQLSIFIALSLVLSLFSFIKFPSGGEISFFSMMPLIVISMFYNVKTALISSFVYTVLYIILHGFYIPPTFSLLHMAVTILLDYILAFSCLTVIPSLSAQINTKYPLSIACILAIGGRFLCHFFSGVLIWSFLQEKKVWFSFIQNILYMGPEFILHILLAIFLDQLHIVSKLGKKLDD